VRNSVGDIEDMENDDAFVLSSSVQSPDVERLVSEVRTTGPQTLWPRATVYPPSILHRK